MALASSVRMGLAIAPCVRRGVVTLRGVRWQAHTEWHRGMRTSLVSSASSAQDDPETTGYGGEREIESLFGLSALSQSPRAIRAASVDAFSGPSRFVSPKTVRLDLEGGKEKTWDIVEGHDSVAVIMYHSDLDAAIVIRQFRPPVWASGTRRRAQDGDPDAALALSAGVTYEICAGLLDKGAGTPAEETAIAEVLEETGYAVQSVKPVTTHVNAAGHLGSTEHVFFAEVDESMRVPGAGGGLAAEGEAIDVLALPMDACSRFLENPNVNKSSSLVIGLMWLGAWRMNHRALQSSGRGRMNEKF